MIISIPKDAELPLLGLIQIGVIDRGSNLLQIRPTTLCNLNCIFCSTNPECRSANYMINHDYLIKNLKEILKEKQESDIEANLDSAGEITTYPKLTELIKKLKAIPEIKFVSMQTNGTLLSKDKIIQLEKAGLNRINLSIHTLNPEQAKELSGNQGYNINQIMQTAREIKDSKIELIITPVWLPKINDKEIANLIKFAKSISSKIAIQKYEKYKYAKKAKIKQMNWFKFYRQLALWEKEYNIKLKYGPNDFNIHRTKKLSQTMEKNKVYEAKIICEGWLKGQKIASANNRSITILNSKKAIGEKTRVKILENKNNIYIAEEK